MPNAAPFVSPLFTIPGCIVDSSGDSHLVKWRGLPLRYATWTSGTDSDASLLGLLDDYESRKSPPARREVDFTGVSCKDFIFDDDQVQVVQALLERYSQRQHVVILGRIGSICRFEVLLAFSFIFHAVGTGPFLIVVTDNLVNIAVAEVQAVGDWVVLEVAAADDVPLVRDHAWAYADGTPKFDMAVVAYSTFHLLQGLIWDMKWLGVAVDASGSLGDLLLTHQSSDFMSGDEASWRDEDVERVDVIEDFFNVSRVSAELVVTIAPVDIGLLSDLFIDSHDDPINRHTEHIAFCFMAGTQRQQYHEAVNRVVCPMLDHPSEEIDAALVPLNAAVGHTALAARGATKFVDAEESGKTSVLNKLISAAKQQKKRMLILTDDQRSANLIGLILQANHVNWKNVKPPYEAVQESFIVTVFDCQQRIDWLPLSVDFVVSFNPIVNPMIYFQPAKLRDVREERMIEIIRLVTIHTHEVFLCASSLTNRLNERKLTEEAVRYFRWPIPEVIRDAKLLLTSKPVPKEASSRFVPHFIEFGDLTLDESDFNDEEWTPETIHELLMAISSFCWGQWEKMSSKFSINLSPGTIREVAYFFLTSLLAKLWLTSPFLEMVAKSYHVVITAKCKQRLGALIETFTKDCDRELLSRRLARIEQLALISLYVASAKRPPKDVKVYPVEGRPPRRNWTPQNDRELIYTAYCSQYGVFGGSFRDDGYGLLCERLRQLVAEYRNRLQDDFNDHPMPVKASPPRLPAHPQTAAKKGPPPPQATPEGTLPQPRKRGRPRLKPLPEPSPVVPEPPPAVQEPPPTIPEPPPPPIPARLPPAPGPPPPHETLAPVANVQETVWSREDDRQLCQMMRDFGSLSATDLRSLMDLESKTNDAIEVRRMKVTEFVRHGEASDLLFRPNREELRRSLSLFDRLTSVNLHDFYEEDRAVLEIVRSRGLSNTSYSPYLRYIYGRNLAPEQVHSIVMKILGSKLKCREPSDSLEGHLVALPVVVAEGIEITDFGTSIGKCYCDEDCIYPVGYSVNTDYLGNRTVCTVENSRFGPVFAVTPRHGFRVKCKGETPDIAWLAYFRKVLRLAKGSVELWRVPGHELFGFATPFFKRASQALPGAQACVEYCPRIFRTSLFELRRKGMIAIDPSRPERPRDYRKTVIAVNFRPLFDRFREEFSQDPPERMALPALPLMEVVGVTTREQLRDEIRFLRDLWHPQLQPVENLPQ
jgi:hypothetical protein